MAASKKDDTKRVMDVSKPGKSIPDSSSRPVIIGHKPMIADPMVNTEEEKSESKTGLEEPIKARVGGEKVVAPPGEEAPEAQPESAPEEDSVDADNDEPKPTDEPSKESAKEPTEEKQPTISEAAVVDALAQQATAKKKEGELTAEDKKRQEQVDKLIEEKTYFVPVGQVRHRKAQRHMAVLFVLLLVVAGGAAAIDAGMLDIGVQLPFDFIKT